MYVGDIMWGKNLGVAWEQGTAFTPDTNNHDKVVILVLHPTPLGEKWSGEH